MGKLLRTARNYAGELKHNLGAVQYISLFAALITVAGFVLEIFIEDGNTVESIVLAAFVPALVIALIAEDIRWHRKARYAEAHSNLHSAYHNLRDAWYALNEGSDDATVRDIMAKSLGAFANAMSVICATNCRACIKDLYYDKEEGASTADRNYKIQTALRDDPTQPEPDGTDWLSDNSDFRYLFKNANEKRFISGDVVNEPGYHNSHAPDGDLTCLPYRSVLVWPIRKRRNSPDRDSPDHDLIGYLCVDTMARHTFWDRYDTEIGAAYADTLYQMLKQKRLRENQ